MEVESWGQECEAAGHTVAKVRECKRRTTGIQLVFSFPFLYLFECVCMGVSLRS